MDAEKPKAQAQKLPPGWHQVGAQHPGHRSSKDEVIAAFEADTTLDHDLKTFMLAKIRATECKALEVHAHLTSEGGAVSGGFHIKPLF